MGTHPIFESDFDCLTECKCCFQSLKTYRTLVTIIAEESNRVADFLERRNGETTLFIGHLCTYLMLFNFIQTIRVKILVPKRENSIRIRFDENQYVVRTVPTSTTKLYRYTNLEILKI